MEPPEIILGFRVAPDGRISVVGPDGVESRCTESDLGAEIRRRLASDGVENVVSRSAGASAEQLRAAYGVLYEYVRDMVGERVGHGVIGAAETVAVDMHRRFKDRSPKGCSARYKLVQARKRRA